MKTCKRRAFTGDLAHHELLLPLSNELEKPLPKLDVCFGFLAPQSFSPSKRFSRLILAEQVVRLHKS